jgi:hypothetical protein
LKPRFIELGSFILPVTTTQLRIPQFDDIETH